MISINLKPGIKRAAPKRNVGAQLQERLGALQGLVKEPLPLAAAAAWIAVLGFLGVSVVSVNSQLTDLEPQLEVARTEQRRFQKFLAEKKQLETVRDSLVTQIATIRQVDGDRYIYAHVLDELAKALPEYTWLVEVGGRAMTDPGWQPPPPRKGEPIDTASAPQIVALTISGRTIDIQAYTKFLRQLEASPWITAVAPVSAQTVVERERAVTAFTVNARYRVADSAYIQTVPLSQSVR